MNDPMRTGEGITVTFLDATGAKSVKAKISPTVQVKKILPSIITKMLLPTTAPDGHPMIYKLDCKELGKQLLETQTLPEAGVKEGFYLIVVPEVVAGVKRAEEDSLVCSWPKCRKTVEIGRGIQFVVDGEVKRYCLKHAAQAMEESSMRIALTIANAAALAK